MVAILGADRRIPGRMVGCEILPAQKSVVLIRSLNDRLGDRPVVEGIAPAFSDLAQCARQVRLAEDLARAWRAPAIDQVGARAIGVCEQPRRGVPPRAGDDLADREALLGVCY